MRGKSIASVLVLFDEDIFETGSFIVEENDDNVEFFFLFKYLLFLSLSVVIQSSTFVLIPALIVILLLS